MSKVKPGVGVKEFDSYLDEADRQLPGTGQAGWAGVGGLPNFWREGEDGQMIPVDPERAQSGGLSDAPPGGTDAAPGNHSPVKYR